MAFSCVRVRIVSFLCGFFILSCHQNWAETKKDILRFNRTAYSLSLKKGKFRVENCKRLKFTRSLLQRDCDCAAPTTSTQGRTNCFFLLVRKHHQKTRQKHSDETPLKWEETRKAIESYEINIMKKNSHKSSRSFRIKIIFL